MKYLLGFVAGVVVTASVSWFVTNALLADTSMWAVISSLRANTAVRHGVINKRYDEILLVTELAIKYDLESLGEFEDDIYFPETKEKLAYWLNERPSLLSELSSIGNENDIPNK